MSKPEGIEATLSCGDAPWDVFCAKGVRLDCQACKVARNGRWFSISDLAARDRAIRDEALTVAELTICRFCGDCEEPNTAHCAIASVCAIRALKEDG